MQSKLSFNVAQLQAAGFALTGDQNRAKMRGQKPAIPFLFNKPTRQNRAFMRGFSCIDMQNGKITKRTQAASS